MIELTPEQLALLDQSAGPIGWLESVEISHPNWPQVLRYVVNSSEPISLTHEDGRTTIPDLIKLVLQDDEITTPILNYRAYIIGRYDVPAYVVKDLEVVTVTRDYRGSSFEAQAPGLNDSGNGEIYSASTDESLEGFYS